MSEPSPRGPQRNLELLERLHDGGVHFCIVGGVAAVLHGATRMTVDLDIAAPFDEGNLQRLVDVLRSLDARHATRPELRVVDEPIERLAKFRMLVVETTLGRLDVLPEVPPLGGFDQLSTVVLDVGARATRVLALEQLIAVKRALRRPKDVEVAIELEAIRKALDV
ncbi:MAG: hypothetical protein AAGA54_05335 [Myxococcota bacterium]